MLKKEVLRGKKEFGRLYGKGNSIRDRYIVLIYLKNGLSYNRRAFLASKKVGNSVQRNRAKRLMKESFRYYEEKIPEGYDIILIARNTINGRKYEDVRKSFEKSLKKAKLI